MLAKHLANEFRKTSIVYVSWYLPLIESKHWDVRVGPPPHTYDITRHQLYHRWDVGEEAHAMDSNLHSTPKMEGGEGLLRTRFATFSKFYLEF